MNDYVMMIWCDQLLSIINVRVLFKFQIFISYSVGIITDYVNFHTFENVRITSYLSEKLEFWSRNQSSLKSAKSYPCIPKICFGYRPVSSGSSILRGLVSTIFARF